MPYREMVGSLLWLANGARPDIPFAVNHVAKCCRDPRTAHWNAYKRILRYLSSTQNNGILYSAVNPDVMPKDKEHVFTYCLLLVKETSYVNADFANCVQDLHSIS